MMYSDAISIDRDMNSLLYSSTFKHPSEGGEFAKIKQLISSSSDSTPNYNHQQHHQSLSPASSQMLPPSSQQQQSSLLRYRSAPSSFFANLIDGTGEDDGSVFDEFLNSPLPSERFSVRNDESRRFPTVLKQEEGDLFVQPQQDHHMMYGNNHNTCAVNLSNNHNQSSNLIRQSSSPAGFFSSLNIDNGIAGMRDIGTPNSSSRMNNHINFSTGQPTSRLFMPQISENGHETIEIGNLGKGHVVDRNDTSKGYDLNAHNDSWNDSSFNNLKRDRNGDLKMYSGLNEFDTQNVDSKDFTPSLVHHLSLPKTSSEMAAVEKFLQFQQDSVPCKIRAKRGHATHPRSIAERVRRNRISDRMKTLQDLFPDLDKQANTADMLDLAVGFIKDLQKEVKTLTDTRARCTCSRA